MKPALQKSLLHTEHCGSMIKDSLKFFRHSHFELFFAVRYFRENTVLLFPSTHTTGYEAGEWGESTVFQLINPASFFKECTKLCVANSGSGAVVTWWAWLLAVYGSHDHHSLIPRRQVDTETVHLVHFFFPAGLSDPFVELSLLPEWQFTACAREFYKTAVHKQTLDPVFNEEFKLWDNLSFSDWFSISIDHKEPKRNILVCWCTVQ